MIKKWKNWPYWLQFGMLLSTIAVVTILLLPARCENDLQLNTCTILNLLRIGLLLPGLSFGFAFIPLPQFAYIFMFLMYFIIGALLGWIYGKIKKW